jgi:PAS domain-containing protein
MAGHITAWSPGMQLRYGFTDEHAHGRTSHHLLRTVFPQRLQDIETTQRIQNTWRGGLIHRHANGRAIMAANHWHMHRGTEEGSSLVTEVHSNIA